MAEEQKPSVVEVPEAAGVAKDETAPASTTPAPAAVDDVAASAAPAAETAPASEDKPAEELKPAEAAASTEAAKADKKDEMKPIEEGHLAHKAQGASFPKNLIPSKEFFFFGSDAWEPSALSHYLKGEKSADKAHSNVAWASHTGKGLLFFGDKKSPSGVINLSDASEPEVDGANKFHFTSKGNKHTFKAASTTERDGWLAHLKLKIAEAKEIAASVTESEVYKKTLDGFKPTPAPTKEEKPAEAAAAAETTEAAKSEPTEPAKEDVKAEEPKPRSASRKRASIFGFGKKEEKKEEAKAEDVAAAELAATPAQPETATEAATPADTTAAATEDKPAEVAESPKEKPTASKRNSFFGAVFSKKEKKPTELTKSAEESSAAPATTESTPATETTAPVIPPVESTTPLAVDVASPATIPTETVETPAVATAETKKDTKKKRKSSLPFAFGKREKSPSPTDGEDKSPLSAFSKLRATIKGKMAAKTEDKPAEGALKEETAAEEAAAEPEPENKPENVTASTPAVTAAA